MALDKKYKYQVGDIIETVDNRIGMIYGLTNAYEYMAIEEKVAESLIKTYINVLIYKVMLNSTITFIQESNIKGIVCREKKNT